jgi:hypothetical protein
MSQEKMFDRYADSVIGGQPEDFNGIEVYGVRRVGRMDQEVIERDNEYPDFFSVYLHYKPGNSQLCEGVQCAGDFSMRTDAIEYAEELHRQYGWPIFIFVEADAKPARAWRRMTDEALLDAAKLNDIEAAVLHVQEIAGITDGGLADQALGDLRPTWNVMAPAMKVAALEGWRHLEEQANLDYAPPSPQNLDVTLILAGLRCLQEQRHQLSEGIIDILAEDNIGVETADDRAQLAENIDSLCERINRTDTTVTSKAVIRDLLPYARSRAEDLHEQGGNEDPAWERANAAVDAGYKAIGEQP